jgi:hypothetical protein
MLGMLKCESLIYMFFQQYNMNIKKKKINKNKKKEEEEEERKKKKKKKKVSILCCDLRIWERIYVTHKNLHTPISASMYSALI